MSLGGNVGRPPGQPKTGGRKAGTPNRSSLVFEQKLAELGCNPIAVLAELAMDKNTPPIVRAHCAKELLDRVYPKRKSIEEYELPETTVELKTFVENAPVDPVTTDNQDAPGSTEA